jgi:phosphoglycolate phosphatase-like HAD superfamily hydrolase
MARISSVEPEYLVGDAIIDAKIWAAFAAEKHEYAEFLERQCRERREAYKRLRSAINRVKEGRTEPAEEPELDAEAEVKRLRALCRDAARELLATGYFDEVDEVADRLKAAGEGE